MRYALRTATPLAVLALLVSCQASTDDVTVDYCTIASDDSSALVVRPGTDEAVVDDVNWFARPVPNPAGDWIIAFASHDQNYLYNLTSGRRIKIPDRSDAVATPDGRYMTVPSYYTPDEYIRFYDAHELLAHLERGEDAHELPPVYIHKHPDLRKVYYQSTGIVSPSDGETTYRLMFSGTASESGFRIVDYVFYRTSAGALEIHPTQPMKLCPEIPNDMNTPFISKDARYVVSYTSSSEEREYSPGSSLKIYRILETMPAEGTTRCEEVVDFGFAAGKADFSYDNSMLTFHISKGGYLTPFVNGGLESPTITDVVAVRLEQNAEGDITGYSDMARLTTSLKEGVGSYFPAFLPDGNLFYVFNAEPKESESDKRFYFKVASPDAEMAMANVFADDEKRDAAEGLGRLWHAACGGPSAEPKPHEAPWVLASLSRTQCEALVANEWTDTYGPEASLTAVCALRK